MPALIDLKSLNSNLAVTRKNEEFERTKANYVRSVLTQESNSVKVSCERQFIEISANKRLAKRVIWLGNELLSMEFGTCWSHT